MEEAKIGLFIVGFSEYYPTWYCSYRMGLVIGYLNSQNNGHDYKFEYDMRQRTFTLFDYGMPVSEPIEPNWDGAMFPFLQKLLLENAIESKL
jgi:hypothetical protein